jgi:NUMOD4 motif
MSERWIDIPEFPDYEISDHGNVFSKRNNQRIAPSWNGTGSVKVNFSIEGVLHTRSVRVLVAEAFVQKPDDIESQSRDLEVMNIDGDMWNNHWENLAWRPHWFVWKYTRQFRDPIIPDYNVGILNTQTGEVFDTVMDAGIADAAIWEYVYGSAMTGRAVYPTGAVYEFVSAGTVSQVKQGL